MRACKKCSEEKPLDDFYKSPYVHCGREATCKDCRRAKMRKNRRKDIDHYREYDRKRGMLPHRVEMRERYQETDAGKAAIYRNTVKYRKSHPIKEQAHRRVGYWTRTGKLRRAECCETCGDSDSRLHAHHDDYAKQLDVRWLCPACHKSWHAKHGEAANADMEPLPRSRASNS